MSNKQDLVTPTLHLNGSGFANLEPQYAAALEALNTAIEKLPVPHGRDYYVQEDGAFERARAQYKSQVERLDAVLGELRTIYRDIHRQDRGTRRSA